MQETTPQSGLGFAKLVAGILDDARALMRQEVQLLKDEVKLELSKAGRAASGFGIGAVLGGVGALFLLLMLVHGLNEWFAWPLWVCYGLVGAAIAASGLALILRARSLAGTVHPTPQRSLHTMKENVQWIKERMTLKRT
ncbi:MAG TPA: phage holin family protein [Nitrospira sp.]|nr:phage holin family protein [Nitrospira sp.]